MIPVRKSLATGGIHRATQHDHKAHVHGHRKPGVASKYFRSFESKGGREAVKKIIDEINMKQFGHPIHREAHVHDETPTTSIAPSSEDGGVPTGFDPIMYQELGKRVKDISEHHHRHGPQIGQIFPDVYPQFDVVGTKYRKVTTDHCVQQDIRKG